MRNGDLMDTQTATIMGSVVTVSGMFVAAISGWILKEMRKLGKDVLDAKAEIARDVEDKIEIAFKHHDEKVAILGEPLTVDKHADLCQINTMKQTAAILGKMDEKFAAVHKQVDDQFKIAYDKIDDRFDEAIKAVREMR